MKISKGVTSAKSGRSAGAVVAKSTKSCSGGTAIKPSGMARSGGGLVSAGKKGKY